MVTPEGGSTTGGGGGAGGTTTTTAINLFIDRGLHTLFDDVMKEPVPEELLRIIEEDRKR